MRRGCACLNALRSASLAIRIRLFHARPDSDRAIRRRLPPRSRRRPQLTDRWSSSTPTAAMPLAKSFTIGRRRSRALHRVAPFSNAASALLERAIQTRLRFLRTRPAGLLTPTGNGARGRGNSAAACRCSSRAMRIRSRDARVQRPVELPRDPPDPQLICHPKQREGTRIATTASEPSSLVIRASRNREIQRRTVLVPNAVAVRCDHAKRIPAVR